MVHYYNDCDQSSSRARLAFIVGKTRAHNNNEADSV